jgi:hypothetical protein
MDPVVVGVLGILSEATKATFCTQAPRRKIIYAHLISFNTQCKETKKPGTRKQNQEDT